MFIGRRFDFETGLYYYRARYYNPYIGRFLQTDPVGYDDGINWYAYCRNNPLAYTDPMGNMEVANRYENQYGINASFIPYDVLEGDPLWHSANDFGEKYIYRMNSWKDVINKLQELKDHGYKVNNVYLHDGYEWKGDYGTVNFGDEHIGAMSQEMHDFCTQLQDVTPDHTAIHFRNAPVGKQRRAEVENEEGKNTVYMYRYIEEYAKWSNRTVTGADDNISDMGVNKPKEWEWPGPDYKILGNLWQAGPGPPYRRSILLWSFWTDDLEDQPY
jgi:RHS repeat-associated protein